LLLFVVTVDLLRHGDLLGSVRDIATLHDQTATGNGPPPPERGVGEVTSTIAPTVTVNANPGSAAADEASAPTRAAAPVAGGGAALLARWVQLVPTPHAPPEYPPQGLCGPCWRATPTARSFTSTDRTAPSCRCSSGGISGKARFP
jgi:hypothetical protein